MSNEDTAFLLHSEEQLAGLIEKKLPMIKRVARTIVSNGLEFDDAVQEGIIGLVSAVGTYNSSKGASFSTYANVCIQNAVLSAAKAAARKKHSPLNGFVQLSDDVFSQGPEDIAIEKELFNETVSAITLRLSPYEKRVLALHLKQKSYSQIAKALQTNEKSVENALVRIRRKLR